MWPWSGRSKPLPEEQQAQLRKRLRPERKAYQSCVKANGGDGSPCRQLEVRLLERYSELVAADAAASYQACYSASLSRGDIVLDRCEAQVKRMRESLMSLGIDIRK